MNFVAHLFLSPCNDPFRVGAVLADFTMGKMDLLESRYGIEIANGIRHHREVDRYTDNHAAVIDGLDGIKGSFGIYGGIVMDVMFDHFLLKHWTVFTRQTKETFFNSVYHSLAMKHPEYPERFSIVIQHMVQRRWLHTYEDLENTAYALTRIGERFQQKTPLDHTLPHLRTHYNLMEESFLLFFPQLQCFSNESVARIVPALCATDAR